MPYKDPKKNRACQKAYRDKNKEKIKKYDKEYREKKAIYARDYYSKNREIVSDKNNHYIFEKNTISREAAFNHRKEWTPEEDTILIKLKKQNKSHKEIGEILGRSIYSVNTRLVKLRKLDPFNGMLHADI